MVNRPLIMFRQILDLLAAGVTPGTILKDYFPQLSNEAILSALEYASELVEEERYVPFQSK